MSDVVGYSRAQIRLHWIIVVLVALQYLFADGISDAFRKGLRAGEMTLTVPAAAHIAGGLVILLLMFRRFGLRSRRGAPSAPAEEPGWAKPLAGAVHWLFYAVLVALPLSGVGAWALASRTAGEVHQVLRAILLGLIALHIAGVVVNQFVWRTGLFARMTRPGA